MFCGDISCTPLKKKRPHLDLERVILDQDNAPGHRAASTQLEISLLGFEVLEHPSYSPDLAPMDFRVFFRNLRPVCAGFALNQRKILQNKLTQLCLHLAQSGMRKHLVSGWADTRNVLISPGTTSRKCDARWTWIVPITSSRRHEIIWRAPGRVYFFVWIWCEKNNCERTLISLGQYIEICSRFFVVWK